MNPGDLCQVDAVKAEAVGIKVFSSESCWKGGTTLSAKNYPNDYFRLANESIVIVLGEREFGAGVVYYDCLTHKGRGLINSRWIVEYQPVLPKVRPDIRRPVWES